MAGGTWTKQDKIRPGVYINFNSKSAMGLNVGTRGKVAICEPMSWGAVATVQTVTADMDTTNVCGYPIYSEKAKFLNEIFKGTDRTDAPTTVYLYRPAGSGQEKATATIDNLTVTAVYYGSRGNDISIIVSADIDNEGAYIVDTVVDGLTVDRQTASEVEQLVANSWVEFSGTGALSDIAGLPLTGGVDGTVASSQYMAFLDNIEPYDFDVIIYDGDDATVKTAFANFVKRLAETQGKYAQAVVYGMATNPDSRYVINVSNITNGVTFADGTTISGGQLTWYVGSATAGAKYNQSLTYAAYPQAVNTYPAVTNSAVVDALKAGEFVVLTDKGVVKIEQDINSLVTYTAEISSVYRKNRVIRTLHTIANDVYTQFSSGFIGVVDNNETGRSLFKGVIVGYMLELQANNAIQNFTAEDVEVLKGEEIDSIVVNIAVQPVDAVEKIYMTITVS